ncbi:MAG: aldehyde dehydrogenase family protein [Gemmatimonadaceae bacterium]|nr:aldehyde dehydrogenase family protein [Gemmatimonadaceae bacterium]
MAESAAPAHARAVESFDAWEGRCVARRASATPSEVEDAIARARGGNPAWKAASAEQRARVLLRFAALVFDHRESVAGLIATEVGKPIGEALASEVTVVLDDARRCARRAPVLLRPRRHWSRNPALWRKRLVVERVPLGVVGVIAPWNYPFMLAAGHILPALAMGNTVVFKPSEYTPLSGERLVALLHEAGVPTDALVLVHGDGRTGDALVRGGVDFVCFTGSAAAGAQVARRCGERMIPCSLELGGADAALVLDDAPIEHAARGLTWGRFMNAGQSCVAPKRVFVTPGAYAPLVDALQREIGKLRQGSPTSGAVDLGGLIRATQADHVRRQRDETIAAGAAVRAESTVQASAPHVITPTLLTDAPDGTPAWTEEIFGPVLVVERVNSPDAAVARANMSPYGLSASVWSRDRARAVRVARRLEVGSVAINDVVSLVGVVELPHGGVKRSGYGRLHGDESLLECTRTLAIADDALPTVANPWWFPYSRELTADFVHFLGLPHGRTIGDRLRGVRSALRLVRRALSSS